jgi:hypothetical protein
LDEYESAIYVEEKTSITHEGIVMLIDFLDKNRELIRIYESYMLDAIQIETRRLYATYGIEYKDVKIRALIIGLGAIVDYAKKLSRFDNISKYKSEIEERITGFLNTIVSFTQQNDGHSELADSCIIEIISFWRELFLKYGEVSFTRYSLPLMREHYPPELQVAFPQETRDKLANIVARGIEDQLKKGT